MNNWWLSWCRIYCYAGIIIHEKVLLPLWTNLFKCMRYLCILKINTVLKCSSKQGKCWVWPWHISCKRGCISNHHFGKIGLIKYDIIPQMIWYFLHKYNMIWLVNYHVRYLWIIKRCHINNVIVYDDTIYVYISFWHCCSSMWKHIQSKHFSVQKITGVFLWNYFVTTMY